jgi:Transposase
MGRVDQPGGSAALLLALLWEQDQRVLYIPGLTVNRASDTYPGESKTDARDAHVVADQTRMRPDLDELEPGEQEVAELRILLVSLTGMGPLLGAEFLVAVGNLSASDRRK